MRHLRLVCCGTLLLALLLPAGTLLAHERRAVGDYELIVGFMVEPALQGLKNGVDLRISAGGQPVEGLEESLEVEVIHVPSAVARTFALRGLFGDPGHYTADLIPTVTGVYRMRVFGTIQGQALDETFISRGGGGGFGDVEPTTELHFPEPLPQTVSWWPRLRIRRWRPAARCPQR